MPLHLDEVTHVYWFIHENGTKEKYDSVTKIIEFLGLSKSYQGISSFYAERGRAVHKAVELIDKGTLDEASVSDTIRPYVSAYRKFLAESGYKAHAWEIGLHHPVLRYAGTIDKVGYLGGRLGILDIKTSNGTVDAAVDDQLCAYKLLWDTEHPNDLALWRYALQLKGDGEYNLITKYTDTPAEDWKAIMKVYRKKQARTK